MRVVLAADSSKDYFQQELQGLEVGCLTVTYVIFGREALLERGVLIIICSSNAGHRCSS